MRIWLTGRPSNSCGDLAIEVYHADLHRGRADGVGQRISHALLEQHGFGAGGVFRGSRSRTVVLVPEPVR